MARALNIALYTRGPWLWPTLCSGRAGTVAALPSLHGATPPESIATRRDTVTTEPHRTIACFGYGSLVNRATRPAGEWSCSARLSGWQRVWSHRVARFGDLDGCSSLNIRRHATRRTAWNRSDSGAAPGNGDHAGIDGVVALVEAADLPALDAREAGYDRLMLPVSDFVLAEPIDASAIAVYVSQRTHDHPANDCFPLLQTYIDCVMAGFEDRFGEAGLLHFLATTDGWQSPVVNDRQAPRYARAVELPAERLRWFDSLLQEQRLAG